MALPVNFVCLLGNIRSLTKGESKCKNLFVSKSREKLFKQENKREELQVKNGFSSNHIRIRQKTKEKKLSFTIKGEEGLSSWEFYTPYAANTNEQNILSQSYGDSDMSINKMLHCVGVGLFHCQQEKPALKNKY
ncbi:uncharacterized protein LOC130446919 [Diorhabda sublineata]|uniref:uncharacterized protein LOC130446919 n=1 Tax=Diorhabda sublineata TaxID=1163346 RepID=UPI0024E07E25|nr:uncharacterized protein LOC130446919 [Diorhabda sublineata]